MKSLVSIEKKQRKSPQKIGPLLKNKSFWNTCCCEV